jgi:hypothetical protein
MSSTTLRTIRDNLTVECAEVMLAYRKYCAASADPLQVSERCHGNNHKLTAILVDNAHRVEHFARPSEFHPEVETTKGYT